MNPNQANPFMQILSQMSQGGARGIAPTGGVGASPMGGTSPGGGTSALQGGMPGGTPTPGGQSGGIPGQQQPGSNATKMLIGALQNLHTFALQALDPQEAQLVRQIIILLSSLIQREQARTLQGGGQLGGGMGGGIQPPMPQGAGGGAVAQPAGITGR